MTAREPIEPTLLWKKNVEQWMIRMAMVAPEPDDVVSAWLDEAADGDEIAIEFVLRTWREIRYLTSLELEMRLAALRRDELRDK